MTRSSQDDGWMSAMRHGNFARAWRIADLNLERRIARGEPFQVGPRHLQSVWTGEALEHKRILVRCYHGLGDTIQYIRFAALLRQTAREVIVWAQPQLVKLVSTAAGVDRVLPLHDGKPDVAFDCDLEIMELAHALRVDSRSVARRIPYLFPNPKEARLTKNRCDLLYVGLVWQAGDWEPKRSVPSDLLSKLAHVRGVRLFSLQYGSAAIEANRIPAEDVSSRDIEQIAATLLSLDVLITVDTFTAHLAGALGLRTWLMLHDQSDWRWMDDRDDSVWYPTMRIFRQRQPDDWEPLIDEVAAALRRLLSDRASAMKYSEQTC